MNWAMNQAFNSISQSLLPFYFVWLDLFYVGGDEATNGRLAEDPAASLKHSLNSSFFSFFLSILQTFFSLFFIRSTLLVLLYSFFFLLSSFFFLLSSFFFLLSSFAMDIFTIFHLFNFHSPNNFLSFLSPVCMITRRQWGWKKFQSSPSRSSWRFLPWIESTIGVKLKFMGAWELLKGNTISNRRIVASGLIVKSNFLTSPREGKLAS